jgi:hypothetical protein
MNQSERQHHQQRHLLQASPQPSAAPGDGDQGNNALYESAARLLAVGDEAINRALSGDSQAFLEANQQTGGQ